MKHVGPEAFHGQFIDRFYRCSSWGMLGRLIVLFLDRLTRRQNNPKSARTKK